VYRPHPQIPLKNTQTIHAVCSVWDKGYRYGFNGKEIDKGSEGMGGGGSTYDYGFRIYNPSLGKFLSVDPLTASYPWNSSYAFAENRPIDGLDVDGLEYINYNIVIDYTGESPKIISKSYTWHNPKQHNEHGPKGQGVQYNITIKFSGGYTADKSKFVGRHSPGLIKFQYGNYTGSVCLYKIDNFGNFTKKYDYDLPAVDAVDNYSKNHDKGYDNLKVTGANGLFADWGATPVDEDAYNGYKNIIDNYKVGSIDPYNNKKVTSAERTAARQASILFKKTIQAKKRAISKFMYENYKDESASQYGYENDVNIQKNYQFFLNKYMHKDEKGNWQRNDGMWNKDENGSYSPKTLEQIKNNEKKD
jgi:RHS repeat-associated protein